jgi:hypothetical protein
LGHLTVVLKWPTDISMSARHSVLLHVSLSLNLPFGTSYHLLLGGPRVIWDTQQWYWSGSLAFPCPQGTVYYCMCPSAWTFLLTQANTCFLVAPGSSFMTSTTLWWGRKEARFSLDPWRVSWMAIARTVGSLEYIWDPALAVCISCTRGSNVAIKIHCWTWGGRGGWDQLIWLVRSLLRNLMAMRANTDLEKLHILLGGGVNLSQHVWQLGNNAIPTFSWSRVNGHWFTKEANVVLLNYGMDWPLRVRLGLYVSPEERLWWQHTLT